MDKNKIMKYVGVGAIVAGSTLLAVGGVAESAVVGVVGGVFALVAVVIAIFK